MEQTILKKYYTNIIQQQVHQYQVQLKDTGHSTMVQFVWDGFFESQEHQTLKQHLQDMYYYGTEDEALSVILINEEKNQCALLAFAFGERITENDNPKWFELNNENMEMLNSIVKSAYGYICMLPITMIGIIREIIVVTENHNSFSFVYRRDFDKEYKMNTMRDRKNTQRLFQRTPEEEYPYDALDHAIISLVKSKFPNAKISSKILLFNTQLRDEQIRKRLPHAEVFINISPSVTSPGNKVMTAMMYSNQIQLEAYSYFPKALEGINGAEWNVAYNFDNFKTLKQQMNRYESYSSVFL